MIIMNSSERASCKPQSKAETGNSISQSGDKTKTWQRSLADSTLSFSHREKENNLIKTSQRMKSH